MQFVELDRLGRLVELVELESMEVFGATAGLLEDAVDGAGIDVADVGGGLDRATMPEALDDPHDGRLGELGVSKEGALSLGEPMLRQFQFLFAGSGGVSSSAP